MSVILPKIEIKDRFTAQVFILYLLNELDKLTESQMNEIAQEEECVSVFLLIEALGNLEEKGLVEKNDSTYKIKENGKIMLREFKNTVPVSIKERSLEAGLKILARDELERSVRCRVVEEKGNYFLNVRFLNEMGGADLMSINVFAPNEEQAHRMHEHFMKNPSETITHIMKLFIV